MLASAVPARSGQTALELGAGVGTAGLCLAARVKGCAVMGAEIDQDLVDLANINAKANGMAARVRFVAADIRALPRALRRSFDHVFCNPPFHDGDGQASPDPRRARARHDSCGLGLWLETGIRRTGPKGTFTAILRADRLKEALDAMPATGVTVFPLWPKRGAEAKRVIVQLRRAARRPLALLPGLVLHENNGRFTAEADAVLRHAGALDLG